MLLCKVRDDIGTGMGCSSSGAGGPNRHHEPWPARLTTESGRTSSPRPLLSSPAAGNPQPAAGLATAWPPSPLPRSTDGERRAAIAPDCLRWLASPAATALDRPGFRPRCGCKLGNNARAGIRGRHPWSCGVPNYSFTPQGELVSGKLGSDPKLLTRVGVWDDAQTHARCLHLFVRREVGATEISHYCLSNAPGQTPWTELARVQAQRLLI